MSIPIDSKTKLNDRAQLISTWWHEVEQKSIELSLDYSFLIHADISDCYGSIYTHAISWALHGKDFAKNNRTNNDLVGNKIDLAIQSMSHGQTNGIPQGSTLMDFIAEIVLGYADKLLDEKIGQSVTNYEVVRFRDDYRIFCQNSSDGEKILKALTEIMIDFGMKLNNSKTILSAQIVSGSIKNDKLYWLLQKQDERDLQKHLLIIHNLAQNFPNSGSLLKALQKYHQRLSRLKKLKNPVLPLIGIVSDIAYNNPKTYSVTVAILSKLIDFIGGDLQKIDIVDKILAKFLSIPNIGHLQIWLQRISIKLDRNKVFSEPVCEAVRGQSTQIWNSTWLTPQLADCMTSDKIVDQKILNELSPIISPDEIELFPPYHWD